MLKLILASNDQLKTVPNLKIGHSFTNHWYYKNGQP